MSDPSAPPTSAEISEGVPPLEIPWELTATTKPLAESGSENWGESQISLFTFAPDLAELDELYPDDKLIYLKFTVSVSPSIDLLSDDPDIADFLNLLLIRPVKRLILDVKITTTTPKIGEISPYFISAAPIRREMIETGIFGVEAYTGASEALSVGKSASTLHESYENVSRSKSKSWKAGASVGAPIMGAFLGGSVGGTSSTVTNSGWRDVEENVDVTNREAAEERSQVYQDDVWDQHVKGGFVSQAARRKALADTYQTSWSRDYVRSILANFPIYMMWDDHEIRDGWGSWASDSMTLKDQYEKGEKIFELCNSYFLDARDTFWHFQMVHNLSDPFSTPQPLTPRIGMGFSFMCGRLGVIVLDDRGARDLWRESSPVLGEEQWKWLRAEIEALPRDVDALAIVVPVPIVSMSPENPGQKLLSNRDDDVKLFRQGKLNELIEMQTYENSTEDLIPVLGGAALGSLFGSAPGGAVLLGRQGKFYINQLDDIRDQWINPFCRPELEALITIAGEARTTNRIPGLPRAVFFVGGDLHSGGVFRIQVDRPRLSFAAQSLITSGIGKQNGTGIEGAVGIIADEDFEIAPGMHATMQDFTSIYNFGVTHILFGAGGPTINHVVAREGDDRYWSIKLSGRW